MLLGSVKPAYSQLIVASRSIHQEFRDCLQLALDKYFLRRKRLAIGLPDPIVATLPSLGPRHVIPMVLWLYGTFAVLATADFGCLITLGGPRDIRTFNSFRACWIGSYTVSIAAVRRIARDTSYGLLHDGITMWPSNGTTRGAASCLSETQGVFTRV